MRQPRLCLLLLACLSASFAVTVAQPLSTTPANPISQYGDVRCGQQEVVVPTSTTQTAAAVGYYYGLSPPFGPAVVKLRVASRIRSIAQSSTRFNLGFGDRSGFTCASGPGVTRTATISTQDMAAVLPTPSAPATDVTVQAGYTLTQLVAYANANNLTLPLGTIPGYLDLTIGGVLATGAHGNGPPGSSNIADIVTSITFVDGRGQVRTVSRNGAIGRALSGGLGMLGIITEVTLRLQTGLSKTKTWAIGPQPDTAVATELPSLIDTYSGRLWAYWRPDVGLVRYQIFEELDGTTLSDPAETAGPTRGGFTPPNPDAQWAQLSRALVAFQFGQPNASFADGISAQVAGALLNQAWVAAGPSGADRLNAATGFTNNLQGQDCNPPVASPVGSCFFDPRVWERIGIPQQSPPFTFEETEFALPIKRLPDFISDMQQLTTGRNALLAGVTWPVSFILFRPGGTTRDLIHPAASTSTAPQRIVWVELATFRPQVFLPPLAPFPAGSLRLQKKLPGIQEAYEQLMTCKYGARPHWGKNWERVYTNAACPVRDLFPAASWLQQLAFAKLYDPAALFESPLVTSLINGGQATPLTPSPLGACTIEMTCYCQVDADCQYQGLPPPLPAFFAPPLTCQTLPSRIFPGNRIKVCLP